MSDPNEVLDFVYQCAFEHGRKHGHALFILRELLKYCEKLETEELFDLIPMDRHGYLVLKKAAQEIIDNV